MRGLLRSRRCAPTRPAARSCSRLHGFPCPSPSAPRPVRRLLPPTIAACVSPLVLLALLLAVPFLTLILLPFLLPLLPRRLRNGLSLVTPLFAALRSLILAVSFGASASATRSVYLLPLLSLSSCC